MPEGGAGPFETLTDPANPLPAAAIASSPPFKKITIAIVGLLMCCIGFLFGVIVFSPREVSDAAGLQFVATRIAK